ncbi:MAG TPA: hypothetical protein VFT62_06820 [Mycobacteriales bacterium]|nr:hypothetical protein [Mycobacteriales bacterium]
MQRRLALSLAVTALTVATVAASAAPPVRTGGNGRALSPRSAFVARPLPVPPGSSQRPVQSGFPDYFEPGIAAAADGTFIIGGNSPWHGAYLWVSSDGGRHYRYVGAPFSAVPGFENGQDTDVAAATVVAGQRPANLYAATDYVAGIAVAVSHDGGHTFQVNQVGAVPGDDRPWLAADGACTLYVAYQNGDSGPPEREMISRFDTCGSAPRLEGVGAVSNPVQTPTDPYVLGGVYDGKLVVDSSPRSPYRHHLYLPQGGFESVSAANNPHQPGQVTLSVAVSTDNGLTFTLHRVASDANLEIWPDQLAVDSAGRLYLVWSDNTRVYLATSADGGRRWSAPQVVSAPPSRSAALPAVAAGRRGQIDVVWYGSRRAGNSNDVTVMGTPGAKGAARWQVYFAGSADGGRHFRQAVVTPPVHTGILCPLANTCSVTGSRDMFEDFGVAISPTTGLASVAYGIDQITLRPGSPTSGIVVGYATQLPDTGRE